MVGVHQYFKSLSDLEQIILCLGKFKYQEHSVASHSFLAAHMFVFYFACLSAFTPPVALAAYAAAGIAKAKPMQVALTAMKICIVAFIIPFVFVYGPAILLIGSIGEIALATTTALIGVFTLASAVEGWFLGFMGNVFIRIMLLVSSIMLIIPGGLTDLVEVVFILISVGCQLVIKTKKSKETVTI